MTPIILPRPPARIASANFYPIKAGTVLHRTHPSRFASSEFNPCLGLPSRFAPFSDENGQCVSSLYAATSREAAVFESIFHDIEANAPFKTVRLDVVEARAISHIVPLRDLRLVGVFAPDLKAWNLERTDLIDTPKSTYDQTVLWAKALHNSFSDVDGLVWTSRQCDPDLCLVLFGDRITEAEFQTLERLEVGANASLLLEIRAYGRRAGIDITS